MVTIFHSISVGVLDQNNSLRERHLMPVIPQSVSREHIQMKYSHALMIFHLTSFFLSDPRSVKRGANLTV